MLFLFQLRNLCHSRIMKVFFCILFRSSIILVFKFRSWSISNWLLCIVWSRGQDIYIFLFRYSIVPVPFLKNLSFSHWFLLMLLWKKISWPFSIELFSDSALFHLSIFVPIPYCLDYYIFILTTEIRQCKSSKFVLFSNNFFLFFFAILCHLYFRVSFSISFSISTKKTCRNFVWGCTDYISVWGEYMILSLPIHEHVFLSIYSGLSKFLWAAFYNFICRDFIQILLNLFPSILCSLI